MWILGRAVFRTDVSRLGVLLGKPSVELFRPAGLQRRDPFFCERLVDRLREISDQALISLRCLSGISIAGRFEGSGQAPQRSLANDRIDSRNGHEFFKAFACPLEVGESQFTVGEHHVRAGLLMSFRLPQLGPLTGNFTRKLFGNAAEVIDALSTFQQGPSSGTRLRRLSNPPDAACCDNQDRANDDHDGGRILFQDASRRLNHPA